MVAAQLNVVVRRPVPLPAAVLARDFDFVCDYDVGAQALFQNRPEHRQRGADGGQVHLHGRQNDRRGTIPRGVEGRERRGAGLDYALQTPNGHHVDTGVNCGSAR